jgi:tetratricopeptide (TPR) repeat protein
LVLVLSVVADGGALAPQSKKVPAKAGQSNEAETAGATPEPWSGGRVARIIETSSALQKAMVENKAAVEQLAEAQRESAAVRWQISKRVQQIQDNQAQAVVAERYRQWLQLRSGAQTPAQDKYILALTDKGTALSNMLRLRQQRAAALDARIKSLQAQIESNSKLRDRVFTETLWLFDPFGKLGSSAHRRAIADVSKSIDVGSPAPVLLLARGFAWMHAGDYAKAIADFTKADKVAPDFGAISAAGRGLARAYSGDRQKSLDEFAAMRKRGLSPALEALFRGRACVATGNYLEAEKWFRAVVKAGPILPQAFEGLAWFLATRPVSSDAAAQQAVRHATTACQLTAWKDWGCLDTLAVACAAAGDFDTAVGWGEKAVQLAPAECRELLQSRLALYKARKPYRPE